MRGAATPSEHLARVGGAHALHARTGRSRRSLRSVPSSTPGARGAANQRRVCVLCEPCTLRPFALRPLAMCSASSSCAAKKACTQTRGPPTAGGSICGVSFACADGDRGCDGAGACAAGLAARRPRPWRRWERHLHCWCCRHQRKTLSRSRCRDLHVSAGRGLALALALAAVRAEVLNGVLVRPGAYDARRARRSAANVH